MKKNQKLKQSKTEKNPCIDSRNTHENIRNDFYNWNMNIIYQEKDNFTSINVNYMNLIKIRYSTTISASKTTYDKAKATTKKYLMLK